MKEWLQRVFGQTSEAVVREARAEVEASRRERLLQRRRMAQVNGRLILLEQLAAAYGWPVQPGDGLDNYAGGPDDPLVAGGLGMADTGDSRRGAHNLESRRNIVEPAGT